MANVDSSLHCSVVGVKTQKMWSNNGSKTSKSKHQWVRVFEILLIPTNTLKTKNNIQKTHTTWQSNVFEKHIYKRIFQIKCFEWLECPSVWIPWMSNYMSDLSARLPESLSAGVPSKYPPNSQVLSKCSPSATYVLKYRTLKEKIHRTKTCCMQLKQCC